MTTLNKSLVLADFTNHSGGAVGADSAWEEIGKEFGVKTNAYGFKGHNTKSPNHLILTQFNLDQADEYIRSANTSFARRGTRYKRRFPTYNTYVDNLLRRNWFQVQFSTQIVAIGRINFDANIVEGGTGWAVQMAMDARKLIYVFDYQRDSWYLFDYNFDAFVESETPILHRNFAGIGTRGEKDLEGSSSKKSQYIFPENARLAIRLVYEKTASCLKES